MRPSIKTRTSLFLSLNNWVKYVHKHNTCFRFWKKKEKQKKDSHGDYLNYLILFFILSFAMLCLAFLLFSDLNPSSALLLLRDDGFSYIEKDQNRNRIREEEEEEEEERRR